MLPITFILLHVALTTWQQWCLLHDCGVSVSLLYIIHASLPRHTHTFTTFIIHRSDDSPLWKVGVQELVGT